MIQYSTLGQSNAYYSHFGAFQPLEETDYQSLITQAINENINVSLAGKLQPNILNTGDYSLNLTQGGTVNPTAVDFSNNELLKKTEHWSGGAFGRQPIVIDKAYYGLFGQYADAWKYVPFTDSWSKVEAERKRVDENFVKNRNTEIDKVIAERYKEQAPLVLKSLEQNLGVDWKVNFAKGANNPNAFAEQVYLYLLDQTRQTTNRNALYSSLLNLKNNDKPIWNWTYANILSDYDVLASTALTLGAESILAGGAVVAANVVRTAGGAALRTTATRLASREGSEMVLRLAQQIGKTTGSPNWWSMFKADYALSTRVAPATRKAQAIITQALETGSISGEQITILQRLRPDLFTKAADETAQILSNPFSIASNPRLYLKFRGLSVAGTEQQLAIQAANKSKLVDSLVKVGLTVDDILLVGKTSSHLNYLFKVGKSAAIQGALDGAANAVWMGKERADQMLLSENIDIPGYNLNEIISSAALFGAFGFALGIGFGAITSPIRSATLALHGIDGRSTLGTPNARRGLLQFVGPDRMSQQDFQLKNALASVVGKQAALAAEVNANSRVTVVRSIIQLLSGSEEISVRLVDPKFLEENNLSIEEVSALVSYITQELIGKSSKQYQIGSIPAGMLDDIIAGYSAWKKQNPTTAVSAFEVKAIAGEDFLSRLSQMGIQTTDQPRSAVVRPKTLEEINNEINQLETAEAVERLGAEVVDGKLKVLNRRKAILEAKQVRRTELPTLREELENLKNKDKTPEVETKIKQLEEKIKRYERQLSEEPLKDNNPNGVIIPSSTTQVRALHINGFDTSTTKSGLLLATWLDIVNKLYDLAGNASPEAKQAAVQLRKELTKLEEEIDKLYRKPTELTREQVRKNWFEEYYAAIKSDPIKLAEFRKALGEALSSVSGTTGTRAVSMNWLSQLRFESGLGELYTRLASYGTGAADIMYTTSDVLFHTMEMLDSSQLFTYASLADLGGSLSVKEAVDRGYRLAMGVNTVSEQLRRMDPRKAAIIEQRVVRDIRSGAVKLSDQSGLNAAEIELANDLITNTRKFFTFFGDQAKKLGKDFEDSFTYVPQMLTRKLDTAQQAKLAQLGYEAAVRKIQKEGSIPWSELERLGQIERGTDGSIINIPKTSLFHKVGDDGKALPLKDMIEQMPKTMDELRLLEARRRKENNELATMPEDLRQILEVPSLARINRVKLKKALDEQKARIDKLYDRAVGKNGGFNIFDIHALAKGLFNMRKYAAELGELDYVAHAETLIKKLEDNGLTFNDKPTSPKDHILNTKEDVIKLGAKEADLELETVSTIIPEITLKKTASDGTVTTETLGEGFVVKQWRDKTTPSMMDQPLMSMQTVLLSKVGKPEAANAGFQYTISNIANRLEDITGVSAGDSIRIGFGIEDLRTGFITEEHIFNWMRSDNFKTELNIIRELTKDTGLNDVELGFLLINKYVNQAKEFHLKKLDEVITIIAEERSKRTIIGRELNEKLIAIQTELAEATQKLELRKIDQSLQQRIQELEIAIKAIKVLKKPLVDRWKASLTRQAQRSLADASESVNTMFLRARKAGKPLDNIDTLKIYDTQVNKMLTERLKATNPSFASWRPQAQDELKNLITTRTVTELDETSKLYKTKGSLLAEKIKLEKQIAAKTPVEFQSLLEDAYKKANLEDLTKAINAEGGVKKLRTLLNKQEKQRRKLTDDTSEEAAALDLRINETQTKLSARILKVQSQIKRAKKKIEKDVRKREAKKLEEQKTELQKKLTKVQEEIDTVQSQIKRAEKKTVSIYGKLYSELAGEEQEALLEYLKVIKGTAVGLESLVFTEQFGKELGNLFDMGGAEALAKWGISPENYIDHQLNPAGRVEYLRYLATEMPGEEGRKLKLKRKEFIEESTSYNTPKVKLETDPAAVATRAIARNKAIENLRTLDSNIVKVTDELDADYILNETITNIQEAFKVMKEYITESPFIFGAARLIAKNELENAFALMALIKEIDPRFEDATSHITYRLTKLREAIYTNDSLKKTIDAIESVLKDPFVEDFPIKDALRIFETKEVTSLIEEYGVNLLNYMETMDRLSSVLDSLYNELSNIELGPNALVNPADPVSITYRQLFETLQRNKIKEANARKAVRDHLGSMPFDTADKASKLKELFKTLQQIEENEAIAIDLNLNGHSLKFGETISNWVDQTREAFGVFSTAGNKTESDSFFNLMKSGFEYGFLIGRVRGEDGKFLYRLTDLYTLTDRRFGNTVPTEVYADFAKVKSIIEVRKQTKSSYTLDKALSRLNKLIEEQPESAELYRSSIDYLKSFKDIVDDKSVFDPDFRSFEFIIDTYFESPNIIRTEIERQRNFLQASLSVLSQERKKLVAAINQIQEEGRSAAKVANSSPELRQLMAVALKHQQEYQQTINMLTKEGFVGTNPQQQEALKSVFKRINNVSKLIAGMYEGSVPTPYAVLKASAKEPDLRSFKKLAAANRRRTLRQELEENADILESEINTANEAKALIESAKHSKRLREEIRAVEGGKTSPLFIKTPEGYVIPNPELKLHDIINGLSSGKYGEIVQDFLRHVIYKRLKNQYFYYGKTFNISYKDAVGGAVDIVEEIKDELVSSYLGFVQKQAKNSNVSVSGGEAATLDLIKEAKRQFEIATKAKDKPEQQQALRNIWRIESDLNTTLVQRRLKRDPKTKAVLKKKDGTPIIETIFVEYKADGGKVRTNLLLSAAVKKQTAQSFRKTTATQRYERETGEALVEGNIGLRVYNSDMLDPSKAMQDREIGDLLSMFAYNRDAFNQFLSRTGRLNNIGAIPEMADLPIIQRGYTLFVEELVNIGRLDVPEVSLGGKIYQVLTIPDKRTIFGRREARRLNTTEFLRYMKARFKQEYRNLAQDETIDSILGKLVLGYSDEQLDEIFTTQLMRRYLDVARKDIRKIKGDSFIDLNSFPVGKRLSALEDERQLINKNFADEVRKNSSSKDWRTVEMPRLKAARDKALADIDAQIRNVEDKIGELPELLRELNEELYEESLRLTTKNYLTVSVARDVEGSVSKTNKGGASSTMSVSDLINKYLNGTYAESLFVTGMEFAQRKSDILNAFDSFVRRNFDDHSFENFVIRRAKENYDEYSKDLTEGVLGRQEEPYMVEKLDDAELVMLGIIGENFRGQVEKVYFDLAGKSKETGLLFLTTELAEAQKILNKLTDAQDKQKKILSVKTKVLADLVYKNADTAVPENLETNAFPLLNQLRGVSNEPQITPKPGAGEVLARRLTVEDMSAYKKMAGSLLLGESAKQSSRFLPEQSVINILNELELFGFITRKPGSIYGSIEDLVAKDGVVSDMFEFSTEALNNELNRVLDFSPQSLMVSNAVRASSEQTKMMSRLRAAKLKSEINQINEMLEISNSVGSLGVVGLSANSVSQKQQEIANILASIEKTESEEIFEALERLFTIKRMQKTIGNLKPEDIVSVAVSSENKGSMSAIAAKEDVIQFLKAKEAGNVLEITALQQKIKSYKTNFSTKIIPKVLEKEVTKLPEVNLTPWNNGKTISVADQIVDALRGSTKHYSGKYAGSTKTGLQEDMEAWAAGMNGEPYTPTTSGTVSALESARAKSYDGTGKPYFNNDDLVDPQNAELASYLTNDISAITQKYAKTAGASISADVSLREKIKQKYGIDLPKNFGWSDWIDILRDYVEGLKRKPLVDFEGKPIKLNDSDVNHLKEVIDGMSRIRREFTGEVDTTELPPQGIRQAARMGKNALLSTIGPFMGTAVLLTELPFSLFRKNGSLESFLKGLEILATGSSRRRLEHTVFAFEKLNYGFNSKFGGEEMVNKEITWFNRLRENFRSMFSPDERVLRESGAGRLWDKLDNFLQHKASLSMELGGLSTFVERVLAVSLEKEKVNIFALRSKIRNALSLMSETDFKALADLAARGDKAAQSEIVKRFTGIARQTGVPVETLSYIRMAKIDSVEEMDRIIRIMEVGSDNAGSFDGNAAISRLHKNAVSRAAKNLEIPMFEESAAKLAYFLELSAREASPEPFGLGKITYKFEKNSLGAQLLFLGNYPLAAFNTYSIRNGTTKTAAAMIALSLGVFGFEIFAKRLRDTLRGKRTLESNYDEYKTSPLAYFIRDGSYAQLGGHLDAALNPLFAMAGKAIAGPGKAEDFKYVSPEFGVMPQASYVNDLVRQVFQAVNGVTKGDSSEAIDLAGRVATDLSVGRGVKDTAGMILQLMEASKAEVMNQQLHLYGPVSTPVEKAFHDYLMQGIISHYVYGSKEIPEFKMPVEPMVKQPSPVFKPVKVKSQYNKVDTIDSLKESTGVSSALAESLDNQ